MDILIRYKALISAGAICLLLFPLLAMGSEVVEPKPEEEPLCDFYGMRIVATNVGCPGQDFTLTAIVFVLKEGNFSPQVNLSWTSPSGILGVGNPISFSEPGLYTVTLSTDCQETTEEIQIDMPEVADEVLVTGSSPVCEGGNILLTSSMLEGYTYEWTGPNGYTSSSMNPVVTRNAQINQSGQYILRTTSPDGCPGPSNEVDIIVNATPEAFPAALIACQEKQGSMIYKLLAADSMVNPEQAGQVYWYSEFTDPDALITNPSIYFTLENEVYAEITSDFNCTSERVVVSLDTTLGVKASIRILKSPSCESPRDGELIVIVSQGNGPFMYDWNIDSLDGNPQPSNLGEGFYEVEVSGDNGCTQTQQTFLTIPSVFDIQCSLLQPVERVGDKTGEIGIIYTGVEGNSTIFWTGPVDGNRSANFGGLDTLKGMPAGLYLIRIVDEQGCSASCEVLVTEPECSSFSFGTEFINPDCAGDASGEIFLVPIGGVEPYDVDWGDNNLDGQLSASNLISGDYNIRITDSVGCQESNVITLTDPPPLIMTCSIEQQATTLTSGDGIVQFDINGGTGRRTFLVAGPVSIEEVLSQDTTLVVGKLPAGRYDAKVVDDNDCSSICSFEILTTACDSLDVSIQITPVNCAGENTGQLIAVASGGTAPYRYNWTNINTRFIEDTLTNLTAGIYEQIIIDALGCRISDTVLLEEPEPLSLICGLQQEITIVGGDNGIIQWSIAGGVGPYQLSWSGAAAGETTLTGQGNGFIDSISMGLVTISLIDANGCIETCEVFVSGPDCSDFSASIDIQDESCPSSMDGALSIQTNGGQAPFVYAWANPALSGANPIGLASGTYLATITDSRECAIVAEGTVGVRYSKPQVTMGAGGSVCRSNCFILPLAFTGEAPFRLMYRVVGPDGSVFDRDVTSSAEEAQIEICPLDYGYTSGALEVILYELFDNVCSSDVFGESLISITAPAVNQIDTTLCLSDFIMVNDRVYDQNNPFGTEIIEGGAANGCDSVIEVTLGFFPVPEIINLETICNFDEGTYQIKFGVIGRSPFQISGLSGQLEAGVFLSETISSVEEQVWMITDERGCSQVFQIGAPDCRRSSNCPFQASTILAVNSDGCAADSVGVTLSISTPFPIGYGQEVVIHDGTANMLGEILLRDTSTTLYFQTPLEIGVNYQLAVIAGRLNGNRVDLEVPCLDVFLGPSISFRDGPVVPSFIQGQDTLCPGSELLLFTQEIPGVSYIWTLPSGEKDTTDVRLLRIPNVGSADEGAYYVQTINGDCPSEAFGPQFFRIVDAPVINAGIDQVVCGPDGVILEATDPSPASGYWLSIGEAPILFNPDSSRTEVDNLQIGANTFIWTVNGTPCGETDTVSIFYQQDPILEDDTWILNETSNRITFDAFRNDNVEGVPLVDSTVFIVAQPDAGTVTYFADEQVFEFTYELSGLTEVIFEYAVCSNSCGTCDTAAVAIVLPDVFLIVPEGITPNNDGRNDFLRIENIEAYPDNEVWIVNRWGQPVYQRRNFSNIDPWDGSFEGSPLPQGAYYLVERVEGRDTIVRKTIHLINRSNP